MDKLYNFKERVIEMRWDALMSHLNPSPSILSVDHIIEAYSASYRFYHNIDHIFEMLDSFDSIKHLVEYPIDMELAIFYHDFIYDPKNSHNEESSVISMAIYTGLNYSKYARARNLILATRHIPGADLSNDEKWIVDLDLMIFGVNREDFYKYCNAIRDEYSHVDEETYRYERKKFLLGMINRENIYNTQYMRYKFGRAAVENINWAIKELKDENS